MRVKVKLLGISNPPAAFQGQKEVSMDFSGNYMRDLLWQFVSGMDSKTKGIFLSENGEISSYLFIIINGIAVSDSNRLNLPLKEGDLIELVFASG